MAPAQWALVLDRTRLRRQLEGAARAAHGEHTLSAGASVGPSVPMSGASASIPY